MYGSTIHRGMSSLAASLAILSELKKPELFTVDILPIVQCKFERKVLDFGVRLENAIFSINVVQNLPSQSHAVVVGAKCSQSSFLAVRIAA